MAPSCHSASPRHHLTYGVFTLDSSRYSNTHLVIDKAHAKGIYWSGWPAVDFVLFRRIINPQFQIVPRQTVIETRNSCIQEPSSTLRRL